MGTDPIVQDIIEYHFKNKEYIFAEHLIRYDKQFAIDLKNELEMQLMYLKLDEDMQEEKLDGLD